MKKSEKKRLISGKESNELHGKEQKFLKQKELTFLTLRINEEKF